MNPADESARPVDAMDGDPCSVGQSKADTNIEFLRESTINEAIQPIESIGIDPELLDGGVLASGFDQDPKVRKAMALLASVRQLASVDTAACEMPRYIGRYRIVESVGRGGFSEVFRAVDEDLSREVALKIPLIAGRPDCQTRFEREAKLAAMLSHPQIVPVYEFGCIGKIDFIAYAWIEGLTLGDWLEQQDGKVSGRLAAEIVASLARAMHYAHERGVVHRDLKPANILVDQAVEFVSRPIHLCTKITDLGLSRDIFDNNQRLTQTGQAIGTPGYMSPEQARGETGIAIGTDIYSLGVMLFELLTGKLPFERANAIETLRAIDETPAPVATKFDTNVSKELAAIADKCLRKEPANRYRSAFDLAEDLESFLAGRSVSVRPAGLLQRTTRWIARNRYLSWTIALVTLSLSVGLAVALWQWQLTSSEALRAEGHLVNTTIAIDMLLEEISDKGEPSLVTEGQREVLTQVLKLQDRLIVDPSFQKFSKSRVNALYRASRIHKALGQYDHCVGMLNVATAIKFTESDLADKELAETMMLFYADGIESLVLVNRGEEAIGMVDEMEDLFDASSGLFDEVEIKGHRLSHEILRGKAYRNANDLRRFQISSSRAAHLAVWLFESGNARNYRHDIAFVFQQFAAGQLKKPNPEWGSVTYETAIALLEDELIENPNANQIKKELAVTYCQSAFSQFFTLNNNEKSEQHATIAIEMLEDLTTEAPKNSIYVMYLAQAYNSLAWQYSRNEEKDSQIGLELIDKAINLREKGLLNSLIGKARLLRLYREKSEIYTREGDLQSALEVAKEGTELAELYFSDVKGRAGLTPRTDIWILYMKLLYKLRQGDQFFECCQQYRTVLDYELDRERLKRPEAIKEAKALVDRYSARLHATDGRFLEAVRYLKLYAKEPWHDHSSLVGKPRYLDCAYCMCRILKEWKSSGQETSADYESAVSQALVWLEQAIANDRLEDNEPYAFERSFWNPIREDKRFEEITGFSNRP